MLGSVAYLSIIAAAALVVRRTRLPGRRTVLVSAVLLPGMWILEQLNGASLDITFGPEAILVTYTVYSAIAVLFASGYVRMCLAVVKRGSPSRTTPTGDAR